MVQRTRRLSEWLKTDEIELAFLRWGSAFESCSNSLKALSEVTWLENGARSRIPNSDVYPQISGAFGSEIGIGWRSDDRELVVGNIASAYPTDNAVDR